MKQYSSFGLGFLLANQSKMFFFVRFLLFFFRVLVQVQNDKTHWNLLTVRGARVRMVLLVERSNS